MIVMVDVQYDDQADIAGVGAVVASDWQSSSPESEFSDLHRGLADYIPGQFYLRELPCILPAVNRMLATNDVSAIVIDGYVDLAPDHAGLGRRLYNAINQRTEIIGVAKNKYEGTHAEPVLRGKSQRALWVTSSGNQSQAARLVSSMHGCTRLPTLIKRADRLARDALHKI